jgi:imidazolonepropionase-like amidohydrolase
MTASTPALRFSGPVLPDGEPRDLYVVDGRVTYEKVAGAEHGGSGWIVPGLVDAHCHVGLDAHGGVDEATTEEQAVADRDAGALLLRDCGSPVDTSWIHDREDLPRLIRAGRHIARTRRYIRNYAHEVEPEDLAAYVVKEAQRGDGWVKLVGDWISRDAGDLAPSFPPDAFAAAIEAAHEQGARVTAHCFGETVLPTLIEAGIDCIEHGTGLTTDLIDTMVARGTALVPTVVQLNNFPQYAAAGEERFPAYAATMRDLYAHRRETIMSAYEAGVPIYAGTDAGGVLPHGGIAGEVLELAAYGFAPEDALGAASWRAREWLGWNATLEEGAPADFVVLDRNPLEDLTVLESPARVVLRGRVVA